MAASDRQAQLGSQGAAGTRRSPRACSRSALIADFAGGEDRIGFGGLGSPELVLEEQVPGDTLLSVETEAGIVSIATILCALPDQLGAGDFLFA
jgi:hypothetical protein